MPVIFAELAATYRPKEVSDPKSPAAAANGQYLLIRRDVYDAVGGHAAVANTILEDVELAKRVKQAGYKLQFRVSDVVSTRMYRSFALMWEGWTKNLALLFSKPRRLALRRLGEFTVIVGAVFVASWAAIVVQKSILAVASLVALSLLIVFFRRIRRAHFDWLSDSVALFGLPLFALLLIRSDISHRRGVVRWKGRQYGNSSRAGETKVEQESPTRTYN